MNVRGIVVEEAYVVSDLHLGGEAPFQIFQEGVALAGLIGELEQRARPEFRTAFVINGDFVDFLAESPARHFDPVDAARKLARITEDATFKLVFEALRRFLRRPGALLGIILGNHDIELALPWVRQELQTLLCGNDEAAVGRIVWALDGQGLLLRIHSPDGAQVLCTHGNEVDGWNVVEHEALRKFGRAGQRGEPLDLLYKPNPGSRMVVDVMNDVKRRYPFVDLLKPETEAVMPILAVLEPALLGRLSDITELGVRKAANDARIAAGLLNDQGVTVSENYPTQADSPSLRAAVCKAEAELTKRQRIQDLLDSTEERFRAGHLAIDLVDAAERGQALGLWGAAKGFIGSAGDKVEALRGHLADLARDRSFRIADEDETYMSMCQKVSSTVDYLVTGHTHLARAITREYARSYYYNTGTWARVFQLGPEVLSDRVLFRNVFSCLSAGTLTALDSATGLLPVRPHFAAFWRDADGTHGELRQLTGAAPLTWASVPDTRFTRS